MKINPHEVTHAIEALARSKGIDPDRVLEAVENAIVAAAKKHLRSKENLVCRFDRGSGDIEIFALMEVVEPEQVEEPESQITPEQAEELLGVEDARPGDVYEIEREVEELGRIAAQAAKQVIHQRVRDAERENIYAEYHGREGEVINGIVKRFERGDIIIDIGRTEAILPRGEQSRSERYTQGERIRAVIKDVLEESRGPQIVLSRTDPILLKKLFEQEVPEIYDNTVEIKLAVREPGERAKIAVISRAKDIDPVGACVGMKGSRVQAVIRELHGEKIDIIPYSDDVITLVTNALSPARVNRIEVVDQVDKRLQVYVDDDQLSLAIGRKGQNVRLASKLVGWKIDVLSERDRINQAKIRMAMITNAPNELGKLPGVGPNTADNLVASDYLTLTSIADATIAELEEVEGIGPALAEKIHLAANTMLDEGYQEPVYEVTEEGEVVEEVIEELELAPGEEVPEGYEVVDEGAPAPSGGHLSDIERARAVLGGASPEEAGMEAPRPSMTDEPASAETPPESPSDSEEVGSTSEAEASEDESPEEGSQEAEPSPGELSEDEPPAVESSEAATPETESSEDEQRKQAVGAGGGEESAAGPDDQESPEQESDAAEASEE